jgi:crossover junction endodeoxyribonuclease RusA
VSAAEIRVNGIPAPQGSKRHVGNGRMIESSRAVGPWREAVRAETQRIMISPLAGPVRVDVAFYLPRPKGHWRTGRNAHLLRDAAPALPCGTPDLDKLARAVLDGLTAGGAWKDDGQAASLHAEKYYADRQPPGCRILIGEIDQ